MLAQLYYDEKLSMQQIANRLNCSVGKVVHWMNQYGLQRRDWSEATYVYQNPDGDPFTIMMPETAEAWRLFGLGVGIYMGEGSKTNSRSVGVSNSNAGVHRTFIKFLEDICGVARHNLTAELHLYPDHDVEGTKQWWADQLGVSINQFNKPWVHEGKSGSYNTKSNHGTFTFP